MKPHKLIRFQNELWEAISYPYPENRTRVIKIRWPGDPTTMITVACSEIKEQQVRCPKDQTTWVPTIREEYTNTHINCPTCYRGYYGDFDRNDRIIGFVSDRPLDIIVQETKSER